MDTPPSWRRDGVVLSRSVFSVMRRLSHRRRQSVSMGDLVGRTLSMSSTTPAVLGATRAGLEADLRRRALAPFAEDGLVDEALEAEALIATRA